MNNTFITCKRTNISEKNLLPKQKETSQNKYQNSKLQVIMMALAISININASNHISSSSNRNSKKRGKCKEYQVRNHKVECINRLNSSSRSSKSSTLMKNHINSSNLNNQLIPSRRVESNNSRIQELISHSKIKNIKMKKANRIDLFLSNLNPNSLLTIKRIVFPLILPRVRELSKKLLRMKCNRHKWTINTNNILRNLKSSQISPPNNNSNKQLEIQTCQNQR